MTVATWKGLEKQPDWPTVRHLPPQEHRQRTLVPDCSLGGVGLGQDTNSVNALWSKYGGIGLPEFIVLGMFFCSRKGTPEDALVVGLALSPCLLTHGTLDVASRVTTTPRSKKCFGFFFFFLL